MAATSAELGAKPQPDNKTSVAASAIPLAIIISARPTLRALSVLSSSFPRASFSLVG
jgi:hypothetical protein